MDPESQEVARRGPAELALKLRSRDGTELEIPLNKLLESLTIERPARTMKCMNCGARLKFSGDAETDHHTMQRHKIEECTWAMEAASEQRMLIEEFRQQRPAVLTAAPRRRFWQR